MNAPATTIVIPAFRAGRTIARTLASVTAQTRPDWEAIVVDDGSPDEGAAIVGRLTRADPRVRLVRQENGGAAAARNRGLAAARGGWTLFLDADDTIDRDYLRRMHARLVRDPSAGAVVCGYDRLAPDGTRLARYPAPRLDRDAIGLCSQRPPTAIHAVLSRTDVLRDFDGFDAGLATNEDWDLWLRLARAGTRFAIERRVLAHYWCAPASLTRDGPAMLRDTLAMLDRVSPGGAQGQAAFDALLWNAGVAIGGGGNALDLPALVPRLRYPPDLDRAVGALAEGLMLGAGRPHAALLSLWDRIGPPVETLLAAIDDRVCGCAADHRHPGPDPGSTFPQKLRPEHVRGDGSGIKSGMTGVKGSTLARRMEREVIRSARFGSTVQAGRTLGAMWSPGLLLRGVAADPAIDRVVVKAPLVRPRSWLMVDADARGGLSGAALARLLIARLRR